MESVRSDLYSPQDDLRVIAILGLVGSAFVGILNWAEVFGAAVWASFFLLHAVCERALRLLSRSDTLVPKMIAVVTAVLALILFVYSTVRILPISRYANSI